MRLRVSRWPHPFRLAFAITDDPDQSTVPRVRAIYDHCLERGIRPTRCTWVSDPVRTCGLTKRTHPDAGVTLDDPAYRELCLELKSRGIEMGIHGVSPGDNLRDETARGLDRFTELFGHAPRVCSFHKHNADNMYWHGSFPSGPAEKLAMRLLVPEGMERFEGHMEGSPYYWGDLARESVTYFRLFRTTGLNVLKKNPSMPFHCEGTPDINFWFSTTAQDRFALRRFTERNLDRLAREDGLILLYAHMAEQLTDDELRIAPEAIDAFDRIAARGHVWNASASEVLDRCLALKSLAVSSHARSATLANPSSIPLDRLQLEAPCDELFLAPDRPVERVGPGRFCLDLPPRSAVALYRSPRDAALRDISGCPPREVVSMKLQEVWRMLRLRSLYRDIRQNLRDPATL